MSDRFEYIDAEYVTMKSDHQVKGPTICQMCRWLEVSRSGFYEWRDRPTSATARRRADLALLVKKSFTDSNETYGYRRVHADLAAWGWLVSPELVRAIMREQGFQSCQPRPWRFNLTDADAEPAPIPDLVRRDFTAEAPGVKLVGDITYIPTWQGWVYLATVIDCHTKEVIGWAMDTHYKTSLISLAIERAAKKYTLAPQAIFHSDRGSNYTSDEFGRTLATHNMRRSVGRTGICYDNAMAESFFAALKNELVYRTVYPTRQHAYRDIARYIELWYNSQRRHSRLEYRTPRDAHNEYLNRQTAA